MNIIEVNNLFFSYDQTVVFNNLNFNIEKNSFTNILGPNGSGKTTLLKIITGRLNSNTYVMIDNIPIIKENYSLVSDYIQVIDEETLDIFDSKLVKTEIKTDSKYIKQFKIEKLLNKKIKNLTVEEKLLVMLAKALDKKIKILIFDNILYNIKDKSIIEYIKSLKITIINFTCNEEEILYGDNIIILNNLKADCFKTIELLQNENLFNYYNIKMPFIIDLSYKLIFYNLIDKIYLDKEKLVEDLWKLS